MEEMVIIYPSMSSLYLSSLTKQNYKSMRWIPKKTSSLSPQKLQNLHKICIYSSWSVGLGFKPCTSEYMAAEAWCVVL